MADPTITVSVLDVEVAQKTIAALEQRVKELEGFVRKQAPIFCVCDPPDDPEHVCLGCEARRLLAKKL